MNEGKLRITDRIVEGVAIVVLEGELVRGEPAELLDQKIRDLLNQDRFRLVLDVEQLRLMDASGLTEIVRAHQRLRCVYTQLKLLHVPKYLQTKLETTRLEQLFPSFHTEAQAVESFSPPATD